MVTSVGKLDSATTRRAASSLGLTSVIRDAYATELISVAIRIDPALHVPVNPLATMDTGASAARMAAPELESTSAPISSFEGESRLSNTQAPTSVLPTLIDSLPAE